MKRASQWAQVNWRLLTLIGAVLAVIGGIGAFASWRYVSDRLHMREIRAEGLAAVKNQHYDKASNLLMEYTSRREADINALYWLALAKVNQPGHRSRQRLLSNVNLLEDVLDQNPKNPTNFQARSLLLQLYRKLGMNDQALTLAKRMTTDSPWNRQAFSTIMQLLLADHRYEAVRKRADAVRFRSMAPKPIRVQAMVASSIASRQLGDLDQAISAARQAISMDDTNLRAHRLYVRESLQARRSPRYIARIATALMHGGTIHAPEDQSENQSKAQAQTDAASNQRKGDHPSTDKASENQEEPKASTKSTETSESALSNEASNEASNDASNEASNEDASDEPSSDEPSSEPSDDASDRRPRTMHQIAYIIASRGAAKRADQLDNADRRRHYLHQAQSTLEDLTKREDLSERQLRLLFNLLEDGKHQKLLLATLQHKANQPQAAPWVRQTYGHRLLERGQLATLNQYVARITADKPRPDSDLLGLRGAALRRMGTPEQLAPIQDQLRTRQNDAIAKGWLAYLSQGMKPKQRQAALQRALSVDGDHAFFLCGLGQAKAELGQPAQAMQLWQRASRLAPRWPRPVLRLSAGHLDMGRTRLALQTAQQAMQLAPKRSSVYTALVRAIGANAPTLGKPQLQRAAKLLTQLENAYHTGFQLTSIRAKIEAALGHTAQADQRVLHALRWPAARSPAAESSDQSSRPTDQADISASANSERPAKAGQADLNRVLNLFHLAQSLNLPRSKRQALDQLRMRLAHQPRAVSARALAAVDEHSPEAGIDLLRKAMPEATRKSPAWLKARLALAKRINAPRALDLQVALADRLPRALSPQVQLINHPQATRQPRAVDRALQRVADLSGKQTLQYRVLAGRVALRRAVDAKQTHTAMQQLQSMVNSGGEFTPGQILQSLAAAHRVEGQLKREISLLRTLANQYPGSPRFVLSFADALRGAGQRQLAIKIVLELINQRAEVPAPTRGAVAGWLAKAGLPDRAIDVLETSQSSARGSTNHGQHATADAAKSKTRHEEKSSSDANRALLARLYLRQGRTEDALALIQTMLEQDPARWAPLAAQVYQAADKPQRLKALADRMDRLDLPRARCLSLRAEVQRIAGNPKAARQALVKATELAPDNPNRWRQRLRLDLSQGEAWPFLASAKAAGQALPAFANLLQHQTTIASAWQKPAARPLLQKMIDAPTLADPLAKAIRAVVDLSASAPNAESKKPNNAEPNNADSNHTDSTNTQGQNKDSDATLIRLARRYPGIGPLQSLALERAQAEDDLTVMDGLAKRLLRNFPDSSGVAKTMAQTMANAGRWDRARAYALQWRRTGSLAADLLLAQAQVSGGQPQQARNTLQTWDRTVKRAMDKPKANQAMLARITRLYVRANDLDKAAAILEPLINRHPGWVRLWLSLTRNQMLSPQRRVAWLKRLGSHLDPANDRAWSMMVGASQVMFKGSKNAELRDAVIDMVQQRINEMQAPTARAYAQAGVLCQQLNRPDQARVNYRQALKIAPDNVNALNNLALILADQGEKLAQAQAMAQRALDQHPDNPSLIDTLATVHRVRGDYAKAQALLKKAIRLDSGHLLWRIHLAETYKAADQWKQFRMVLRQIDRSQTDSLTPETAKHLKQLRSAMRGHGRS